ncbi:hypothetical protein [Bacillus smithii]|uniref:hypothetical protein n=1 Tax=Bacillus smithii TaxID=1479 RepID=UPI0030C9F2B3
MDRKTLEYMEERARKARAIVKLIEELQRNIEQIHAIKRVNFLDQNYSRMFDSSVGFLTDALKKAYVEAAQKEIQRLEQELAEL